jgi:hypothetical protein
MACRTPDVRSDDGGHPHIITHSATGLLVPPGDQTALAAACRRLLVDPVLADRLGDAGRELAVARYAWPHLTEKYLGVFTALARHARPASRAPLRQPSPAGRNDADLGQVIDSIACRKAANDGLAVPSARRSPKKFSLDV